MSNLTYTAVGQIDVSRRSITLSLYLPTENSENPYEFNYNFNLSKITIFDKRYNVIFCHLKLKDDKGDELNSQIRGHEITLNIDKLIKNRFIGSMDFDFDLEDTLFLLLHDDNSTDVILDSELLFINIESIFEKITSSGNQSMCLPSVNPTLKPRRLGMSIIKQ